jgi:soluble lytic murein transglycosylase-like protein
MAPIDRRRDSFVHWASVSRRAVKVAEALMLSGVVLTHFGVAQAGTSFRFEDDAGTVHYTNVPSDPRYRVYRVDPDAVPAIAGRRAVPRASLAAFTDAIRAAAERYQVDQRLVEAVILVESAGNPDAVSSKGAQGLMQLMPARAAALGVRNAFNPIENLDGGVRHLRDLLRSFAGDVTLALAAYNAGEGAVRNYRGVPPYPETQAYVRRIRSLYDGAEPLTATAAAVLSTPQEVYRRVEADGTVVFTNLPPRSVSRPTP